MRQTARQRGFTLASLLVILTIMAVVLAYTVPTMWSDVMRRERDYQTIWVMKQYARAIYEFQRDRGAPPMSLKELKEHNTPRRVLRRLYVNPLSGKMDWILVLPGTAPGQTAPGMTDDTGLTPSENQPAPLVVDPMTFQGQFIGVRPPQKGKSFVSLNGRGTYEMWSYTTQDLQQEITGVQITPGAPGAPTGGGTPGGPGTPAGGAGGVITPGKP